MDTVQSKKPGVYNNPVIFPNEIEIRKHRKLYIQFFWNSYAGCVHAIGQMTAFEQFTYSTYYEEMEEKRDYYFRCWLTVVYTML